jgi:AmiR/NasT family two-component response regulator
MRSVPNPPETCAIDTARYDAEALRQRIADLESEVDQLREALSTRAVIEQAKGVLIALYRYDAEAAFGHLKRVSQASQTKLWEVARDFMAQVEAGETPTEGRSRTG